MSESSFSAPRLPVVLILAVAENGVIGVGDELPWDLKDDLQYFKQRTIGKPIIMGRKTFDSVGSPLPGRCNIVITRDVSWCHENVLTCHSLDEALHRADRQNWIEGSDAIMIVGGAEIYRLALPVAEKILLTRVHGNVVGDVVFDLNLLSGWIETPLFAYKKNERNSHDFSIMELSRKWSDGG